MDGVFCLPDFALVVDGAASGAGAASTTWTSWTATLTFWTALAFTFLLLLFRRLLPPNRDEASYSKVLVSFCAGAPPSTAAASERGAEEATDAAPTWVRTWRE